MCVIPRKERLMEGEKKLVETLGKLNATLGNLDRKYVNNRGHS